VNNFDAIDVTLNHWAEANSLRWYIDYQDVEVRTLYLNPSRRDRVQIAVDVPKGEQTVVRIGQNRKGLSRLSRQASFPTSVSEISEALDRAMQAANVWIAEDDLSGG
jgi:hypothetical protein